MIDKSAVIHSTAIVSDDAIIGPGVTVGPWTVIGSEVEIGEGTSIASHCVIKGPVKIGKRNKIFQFATIGEDCQDKKYAGERTFLEIGDDNVANNATLAGHVHIGNWVIFGGLAAIHQFGRVGDHAFIAGMAALNQDVPPFVMAAGHYAKPFGINKEGLRRRGFSNEAISTIRLAYMIVYKESKTVDEAIDKLGPLCEQEPSVQLLVDFLKESTRGICR